MRETAMICSSGLEGGILFSDTNSNLSNGARCTEGAKKIDTLLSLVQQTNSDSYKGSLGVLAPVLTPPLSNVEKYNIGDTDNILRANMLRVRAYIRKYYGYQVNDDVAASWKEFNDLDECAVEEDIEKSGETAKQNAKKMLDVLCREFPAYYMVYPEKEKSVAIEATARKGHRVLLICENDGRVSCFLLRDDINRRAHYSSMKDLPDSFIREALSDLK